MKTKHTILIFVAGVFITVFGLMIRTHYPFVANVLLIGGSAIELTGAVLFVYKLFTCPKEKSFWNW